MRRALNNHAIFFIIFHASYACEYVGMYSYEQRSKESYGAKISHRKKTFRQTLFVLNEINIALENKLTDGTNLDAVLNRFTT